MGGFQYQEKPKAKRNVNSLAQKEQSEKEECKQFSNLSEYKYQKNKITAEQHNSVEKTVNGSVIINNSNSLVAEQVTDLVNISLQQSVKSKIKDATNNLKTKLYIPRILLFSLTGILTLIFAFPNTILENPILQKPNMSFIIEFINGDVFPWLWFSSLIVTVIVWCILFFYKEKMKQKLSKLTLESKQNAIFDIFINSGIHRFSKDNFTECILGQLKDILKFKKIINRFLISIVAIEDISQDISDLIINKAINKEIIDVVDTNSLSDLYEVKEPRQACLPLYKTTSKFKRVLKWIKERL